MFVTSPDRAGPPPDSPSDWTHTDRDIGTPSPVPGPCEALWQDQEILVRHFREQQPFETIDERCRSLGELARGVVHNIRGRLCAVSGGLQMSLQHLAPGPERDILALAERSAVRINDVLNDLLSLTHPPDFRLEWVSLNDLLRSYVEGKQWRAGAAGVALDFSPGAHPCRVRADRGLLAVAMDAALTNALEAVMPGGRVHIEVRRNPVEHTVAVVVTDTGPGVSENIRRLAFEPYFTTKPGARGMGLPKARWMMQIQGGAVRLENTPAGGASAVFEFPPTRNR